MRRRRLEVLILKLAQRCNLNCSYCYMYQHADQLFRSRPVFMSARVFDALLRRVADHWGRHGGDDIAFVLHGGEPMLFDPHTLDEWLTSATAALGNRVSFGLQTNATLVNDDWIEICRRHRIRVSVSLDGTPAVHDAARVDHKGRGSYAATVHGLRQLMDAGLDPGALCVINPSHAGADVYRHIRSLGVTHMNFLLPDATHESRAALYGPLGGTPVADYLVPIFDAWMDADDPHVRIRLFRDIIGSVLGDACRPNSVGDGADPQNFLIIDTDGSIQASDVLKVCYEGAGESGLNVLTHGFDDLLRSRPLVQQLFEQGMPLAAACQRCHERTVCAGGKVPHRYSSDRGFDNPTVWCSDMLKLIGHIRSRVGAIEAAASASSFDVRGATN